MTGFNIHCVLIANELIKHIFISYYKIISKAVDIGMCLRHRRKIVLYKIILLIVINN